MNLGLLSGDCQPRQASALHDCHLTGTPDFTFLNVLQQRNCDFYKHQRAKSLNAY